MDVLIDVISTERLPDVFGKQFEQVELGRCQIDGQPLKLFETDLWVELFTVGGWLACSVGVTRRKWALSRASKARGRTGLAM